LPLPIFAIIACSRRDKETDRRLRGFIVRWNAAQFCSVRLTEALGGRQVALDLGGAPAYHAFI
jgi:hypothetical protein